MSTTTPRPLPAGTWPSAITPDLVTSASPAIDYPIAQGDCLYWLENRPAENGRGVIVERNARGQTRDLLPRPLSARSRIHEYGGRPYCIHDRTLYFCLEDDQRIWRLGLDGASPQPEPLTPDTGDRYAELTVDSRRRRLLAVREQLRPEQEPAAALVAVDLDGSHAITELVSGSDFYAFPRLSPDGNQLAWITWQHPHMPWDHSELWCAFLNKEGHPTRPRRLAGHQRESVFQPEWASARELIFVTDRSNWWNLYCCDTQGDETRALLPMAAEFATPLWTLGMSTLAISGDGYLHAAFTRDGLWSLGRLNLQSGDGDWTLLNTDCTQWHGLAPTADGFLAVGAAADRAAGLYRWQGTTAEPVRSPDPLPVDGQWISHPASLYFPAGNDADTRVHALYYAPANPDCELPAGELPPLMVIGHGGPTGATATALNFKIQFWTSRGFAVLDVNYRGSTGFGRRYRQALNGRWGEADVDDLCAGAQHLVAQHLADPARLIVRGSSAGGFTVLSALTFRNVFSAGASLYGIGDLETLARDTHKFEARYLDSLVGPYPEARDLYRRRSPIHHSENIRCPVIFFQGLEDRVVPPDQAEAMVARLRRNGTPVAYLPIPEEGHGFRRAANVRTVLESELAFYGQVFDFAPAGAPVDLTIHNR